MAKEKETKFVHGTSIMHMHGHDRWISCTLDNGEKLIISVWLLFELFDKFGFNTEKYGNRFRATGFESET